MAIQNRRGNESDFDPNKMLPGEWATTTDTEKVFMCFKPGKVRRMATYEDMVENIGEATEEIKAEFTAGVKAATEAAAGAANTANKAAETASNASNTANAAAETAMNAAEKAEAAAGGDISEKTVSFEEVETYSKPTSGSKISSIIANLVMGISQLLSGLANKIDSSKILSTEEWGAAISERGYLADAKDVKDSFTQLNTKLNYYKYNADPLSITSNNDRTAAMKNMINDLGLSKTDAPSFAAVAIRYKDGFYASAYITNFQGQSTIIEDTAYNYPRNYYFCDSYNDNTVSLMKSK